MSNCLISCLVYSVFMFIYGSVLVTTMQCLLFHYYYEHIPYILGTWIIIDTFSTDIIVTIFLFSYFYNRTVHRETAFPYYILCVFICLKFILVSWGCSILSNEKLITELYGFFISIFVYGYLLILQSLMLLKCLLL